MSESPFKEVANLIGGEILKARTDAAEGRVALEMARANTAAILAILQATKATAHVDILSVMTKNLEGAEERAQAPLERALLAQYRDMLM